MDDLLDDFVIEAEASLAVLDDELGRLASCPSDADGARRALRLLHSIKGTSGFLGLSRLEAVTHAAEGLVERLGGLEPEPAAAALALLGAAAERMRLILTEPAPASAAACSVDALLIRRLDEGAAVPSRPARRSHAPLPLSAAMPRTVRVETAQLDALTALAGELVRRSDELRRPGTGSVPAAADRVAETADALRAAILRIRTQPIGAAWAPLPRLVRDLGRDLGKEIAIRFIGDGIVLDRSIVETIRSPMLHMVRNAADHGIEPAAERLAAGKPAQGTIRLGATATADRVTIEVGDDGRGLAIERIAGRALDRGIATRAELAQMSDRQVAGLIFAPGLSTAAAPTRVSGRGVGLDVVQAAIGSIGGTVDVASAPGQGTTFVLTIPLAASAEAALPDAVRAA